MGKLFILLLVYRDLSETLTEVSINQIRRYYLPGISLYIEIRVELFPR